MNKLTLALGVIALLGVAASATLFVKSGGTRRELEQKVATADRRSSELQTKLDEATARAASLQQQLAALDADLGDAKSRVTMSEARSVQATRDLATLRNELAAKQQAEQAFNSEMAQLKRELVQAKLAATGATPEDVENYRTTIAGLEAKVAELQHLVSVATRSVPATSGAAGGATTSTGDTPRSADPRFTARVVSVGPSNAFVVINYGSGQGAQTGQNLLIRRGTDTLATVQINDVRESHSIAHVLPDSLRGALRKGDSASISN